MARQFKILNNNILAFSSTIPGGFALQQQQAERSLNNRRPRSLVQTGNNTAVLEEVVKPAVLCPRPNSLMMLWKEYKVGINGNKPAEQFTKAEKNNRANGTKQKYHYRSKVWNLIERLVKSGFTAEVACHRINQVYGFNITITQIIRAIAKDNRERGGHPNLR